MSRELKKTPHTKLHAEVEVVVMVHDNSEVALAMFPCLGGSQG